MTPVPDPVPPPMTLRSLTSRYLGSPRIATLAGGFLTPCPACHTPNALHVEGDAAGAYASCFGRVDVEAPCTSADIAAALSMTLAEWEAALSSVRPSASPSTAQVAPPFGSLLLGFSDLAGLPVPEPLIESTLDRRTLAFVSGAPGSAKSFLLLAWAAHIATGTPWMGRTVEKGRVLYIVAEGAFGIHDRLSAWSESEGVTIPDDGLRIYPDAVQLLEPEPLAALRDHVAAEDYDLVVIDTLSRCAVGIDENSSAGMSRFVEAAESIKRAMTRGSVVIAHHSSKAGSGLRGSSAIEGAADTIYLTFRRNDGVFSLVRDKNKYGPIEDVHTFTLEPSGPSVVLVPDVGEVDKVSRKSGIDRIWAILDATFGLTSQPFTRFEAKTIAIDREDPDHVSAATFNRAWPSLAAQGVLDPVPGSTASKAYWRIDRARAVARGLPLAPAVDLLPELPDVNGSPPRLLDGHAPF